MNNSGINEALIGPPIGGVTTDVGKQSQKSRLNKGSVQVSVDQERQLNIAIDRLVSRLTTEDVQRKAQVVRRSPDQPT